MQRELQNVIFTNHAIERLKLRRISQQMVVQTVKRPDDSFLEDDGDTRFIKDIKGRNVHIVARQADEPGKWLVISAWVRGEDDPKPLFVRILQAIWGLFKRR
jgi:hypothetical protein